jgi:malonyl-CoA O-methyltransferase
MTRVAKEFSRFANTYKQYNRIQIKVAQKLVSMLPQQTYNYILDVGCGRGEVYKNLKDQNIKFRHLSVIDISEKMLSLHPDDQMLQKIQGDFSHPDKLSSALHKHYDLILSASALQWSSDLGSTFRALSELSKNLYFAIFTSGTFRLLHQCAGINSPIYNKETLKEQISKQYDAIFEIVNYRLYFDSVYGMLQYIKRSGVNGGGQHLSYVQTKELIRNYPYDYLEFEVLFVSPKS